MSVRVDKKKRVHLFAGSPPPLRPQLRRRQGPAMRWNQKCFEPVQNPSEPSSYGGPETIETSPRIKNYSLPMSISRIEQGVRLSLQGSFSVHVCGPVLLVFLA